VVVVHRDAGVVGITAIPGFDPASGMHLDDDNPGHPAGAMAAVDGIQIGITPTYWAGEANGREHEFTFVLDGHATARYRFVPVTSGVIHGHLEPVAEEANDAGVPPPEVVPRPLTPPPAPTTLVTPVDAAPRPPAPDAPAPVDAEALGPQP